MHYRGGVHHLPQRHLSGCPAIADLRGISYVPCGELPDMAWISHLSGRTVPDSDAGAQHELCRNPDMSGGSVYGDHPRSTDLRRRGELRTESVMQNVRYLRRGRDMLPGRDMWW
jgi:hypothetical protein